MNPISQIYYLLFYQPLFRLLSFFYLYLKDFGLSIIFLTFFVRLILFPLSLHSFKTQQKLKKIHAELEKIKKYPKKEKVEKMVELYQKEKINPLLNFLPLFFQFPILVALYQLFLKEIKNLSFQPEFLGLLNLSHSFFLPASIYWPTLFLVLAVCFLQFFQTKISKEDQKTSFFQFYQYFILFFLFLVLLKLPAAVSFYLLVNSFFSLFERSFFLKRYAT